MVGSSVGAADGLEDKVGSSDGAAEGFIDVCPLAPSGSIARIAIIVLVL